MKKVTYVIENELHHDGGWFAVHSESELPAVQEEYNRYIHNSKGNKVMSDMQARIRIRKMTEEVLIEGDLF
jgi:N-glycosylase/DNA lyase